MTHRSGKIGGGMQTGDSPKVIPVVVVIRAKMLGAETRGQQTRMWRIVIVGEAFFRDPAGAA